MERRPFTHRLEKAKHVYFSIYLRRFDTFENWPISKTQTKQQMAEAGFFYTERKDHVVCFFCGLCLGDWKDNEDPWKMHAFWIPDCIYLLEIKGQEYVNSHQIFEEAYLRQTETQPHTSLQDTEATLGSVIEENSGSNSGSSNIPSDIESILRNMSVEDKSVEDKSVEDKSVQDKSVEDKSVEDKNNIAKSSDIETNICSSTDKYTTLLCAVCVRNKRDVAFLHCMHIVACAECSKKLKTCPVCRLDILRTISVNLV